MMKTPRLVFVCLFLFIGLSDSNAQFDETMLTERYGAIRADMLKQACKVANMNDTAMLNLITNRSVQAFKLRVKNDTIKAITNGIKPLKGKDINGYIESLRESRRHIVSTLGRFYPSKEEAIDKQFIEYIKKIDDVTNELTNKPQAKEEKDSVVEDTVCKSAILNPVPTKEKEDDGIFHCLMIALLLLAIYMIVKYARRVKQNSQTAISAKPINHTAQPRTMQKYSEDVPVVEDVKPNMLESIPDKQEEAKDEAKKDVDENVKVDVVDRCDEDSEEKSEEKPTEDPEEKAIEDTSINQIKPEEGKSTAVDAGDWILVGASVQGNGHIKMDMPCQDNHGYIYLSDGWGIAIVSDGAGSAKLSNIGSAAVVSIATHHFKELIEQKEWKKKNELPSDDDWTKCSYQVLKKVHDEVAALAIHNNCEPKDLNATVIVVIHTPNGLLVTHVGDGRAGYKDMEGNWHKLITPHKGEEANQTVFLESGFWNKQSFEMSGVSVPESLVLRIPIMAFTLMSDGCENTSWLCNQYNKETGKYFDPNVPYARFFDPLIGTLQLFRESHTPLYERKSKWYNFIKDGIKAFVKETDDKTMILAARYKKDREEW